MIRTLMQTLTARRFLARWMNILGVERDFLSFQGCKVPSPDPCTSSTEAAVGVTLQRRFVDVQRFTHPLEHCPRDKKPLRFPTFTLPIDKLANYRTITMDSRDAFAQDSMRSLPCVLRRAASARRCSIVSNRFTRSAR